MAAVNHTSGEAGMLLIGADGSIKLHGGSTIFNGENQTQHTLLAQKNADGTMNVYMVPNTGPNKGKMFMVMPSPQNSCINGQGWRMATLSDGKTILTPIYRQNTYVYVPPTSLPPHIDNTFCKQTSQVGASLKFVQNSPSAVLPVAVSSSTIMVSNSVVNTISSQPVNTKTVTTTSNCISSNEQETNMVYIDKSKDKTNLGQGNALSSDVRPMFLFTHEAAANLGKNNLDAENRSNDLEAMLSKTNTSEVTLPMSAQSNKVIYPVISSVKKPNILIKAKPTEDKSTVSMASQAGFISPLTSAPVYKPEETLSIPSSSSNSQALYTPVKNVIAIPGKLTSSGKQIIVYPRATATVPSNTSDLKVHKNGYISLLHTGQSEDAQDTPVIVSSYNVTPTSVPVPIVAQSPTNIQPVKASNGHYIITLHAENPSTQQKKTPLMNMAQNSSKLLNTSTTSDTFTTASTVWNDNSSKGSLTPSHYIPKPTQNENTSTILNAKTDISGNKSNLPLTNATNTTFVTNSSKLEYSTVMQNSASSILQTVAEHIRETPKIVHVDFSKELKHQHSQVKSTESTTMTPETSKSSDDLTIRIDSVFSLISQGEETDSSDETKHAVKEIKKSNDLSKCASTRSKHFRSNKKSECVKSSNGSSEKPILSKYSKKSCNILDVMANVKLSKEALLDPLLNKSTYVVLETISTADYETRNTLKPCSRQCRERWIRSKEKQKMKDLQYKIEALKTKINAKKWKNLGGKKIQGKSPLEHYDLNSDIEMPQLEPALATDPILASEIDIDMPDIRSSPPSGSDISQNRLNFSKSYCDENKSFLRIQNTSNVNKTNATKFQPTIQYLSSNDQTHKKVSYKVNTEQKSGVMEGTSNCIPSNSLVSLISSVKTSVIKNNPKQSTASAQLVPLNIPSTLSSSTVTEPTTGPGVNTKFYLIKVDDKSILIPAVNTGTNPRAYILDPKSESSTKLVADHQDKNKSSNASTSGTSNLRLVVPSGTTTNTKLTTTWSNPPSVDPNKVSVHNTKVKGNSSNVQALVTNLNNATAANTFGNVRVKQEPVTDGYGDEIVMPKIKKEKYRGYSDESPPESSKASLLSKSVSESGCKRQKEEDNISNREHTDEKIQKVDEGKSEEENAKTALKEERIKNLKDMLKKQEQALEELRRKRFSNTSLT